jgi:predicted nucleic acid-binding protein
MIVVADTSPLRYLVVIGRQDLLPALYGRVLVPPAVAEELKHESAPAEVRAWMAGRPKWLEVREPARTLAAEMNLERGEQEAIALAEELSADLLLVDEWDARQEAARRHLRAVGTLRVLADGATRGLTNLEEDFRLLRETNFRASSVLFESLLDEYRQGKNK